mmetsp:Transcript_64404/g.123942  ORF Transcript_64404/g.123942 Transcript_64404/m.123942 type:complete len:243 (-) Transcript_64404:184-912(-)
MDLSQQQQQQQQHLQQRHQKLPTSDVQWKEVRQRSLALLQRCLGNKKDSRDDASPPGRPCAKRDGLEPFPTAWEDAWEEIVSARAAQDLEVGAVCQATGVSGNTAEVQRMYKAKVRFLAAVLRRNDSLHLKRLVLTGAVCGRDVAGCEQEALLPQSRRLQLQKHREEALRSVWIRGSSFDFFDAGLSCPQCRSIGARYSVLRDGWALPRCGGCQGHMRMDSGKRILAECSICSARWQQEMTL